MQRENSVTQDFGVYDCPDDLLKEHQQEMSFIKAFAYRNLGRHLMNRNVKKIRKAVILEKSEVDRGMDKKEHLPVIGVGPLIVIPQIFLTALSVVLSAKGYGDAGKFSVLKIPFGIVGVILIIFGICLWCSANFKTKVEQYITENRLVTTGVYAIVRNPIYSAFLLACTGIVLLANNLFLLAVPLVCWIYMTILLKLTEEKWLKDLYGKQYTDYCKKVNRCIPMFLKR